MPNADEVKHALTECQALHANGKYQQAEALALWCIAQSQSIEDDLLLFRSYSALGHVLRASERFSEALNALTSALILAKGKLADEQVAIAWNSIGGLFLGGCAWQLAIECFYKIITDSALSKTADAYKAHGNLALCHLYCGNVTLGLSAICQALRMAPADLLTSSPYSFTFMRNTLVQLALRSDRIAPGELVNTVAEARHCRSLHPDNRSVDLLCDLIEGSVAVADGQKREAGINLLYGALQKARYAHELMTDVLGCLVQAEFLAGRTDKVTAHLETWIARTYDDAGWQAVEKLGLHSKMKVGAVLYEQWPELALGRPPLVQGQKNGPPLPPGVVERFSAWIIREAEHDAHTAAVLLTKGNAQMGRMLLELLAEGLNQAQIAARMKLTEYSVKTMLPRLYKSMGVANREAAIAHWRQHSTGLTVAAQDVPGCLSWYRFCLLRHEFEDALLQWHSTPPRLRDSRARLILCLMHSLRQRESALEQESAYLLPGDAAVFVPFYEWWLGCDAALPQLQKALAAGTTSQRYCIHLALYFGYTVRKQYAPAARIIAELKAELGIAPTLVGEGDAPCV